MKIEPVKYVQTNCLHSAHATPVRMKQMFAAVMINIVTLLPSKFFPF